MSDYRPMIQLIHACRVAVGPTRLIANDGGFLSASSFIGPTILDLADRLRPDDVIIATLESTVARFCTIERVSETQILIHNRTSTGVSVTSPATVSWYRLFKG